MNNTQSPKSNPSDKNLINNRIYSKYSPHSDNLIVCNGCHCQDMNEEGGANYSGQLKDENATNTEQSKEEDDTIYNDKNVNKKQNIFSNYNLQIISQV